MGILQRCRTKTNQKKSAGPPTHPQRRVGCSKYIRGDPDKYYILILYINSSNGISFTHLQVSRYYWNNSKQKFSDFAKCTNVSNLDIHCIDGNSVCNYFIRFENLEEDIVNLCKILGIKNYDLNDLPNHKSSSRKNKSHYRNFYDEETRKIVYENHKKEFELFGYKF